MSEAVTAPALRFPEFEGDWEDSKAGDAFSNSRAKGEAGLPIYSVTMDRGLVRRDSLDRHMHGDAADETNLRAQSGDIVYNMMRMWQGAAGIAAVECMVSPAYVVLSPKENTSSEFFNYRIENARMLYLLWAYSHGLTSDRLRLYFADFARIPIRQPSLPEQKKIAAFLGVVDAKLAALRERVALLERYKRGLMQALFSQSLRFTKPDGTAFPDWEEKVIGDVLTPSSIKGSKGDDARKLSVQLWARGVRESGRAGSVSTQYFVRSAGQFIYSKLDFLNCAFGLIPKELDGLESTVDLPAFDISKNVSPYFLLNYVVRRDFYEKYGSTADGSRKARRIQEDVFMGFPILLPHPDEQQKIADALSAMDAKIAAVSDQVAQMEQFKKGLLQQMFV